MQDRGRHVPVHPVPARLLHLVLAGEDTPSIHLELPNTGMYKMHTLAQRLRRLCAPVIYLMPMEHQYVPSART